jgi:hypothetical protein
MLVFLNFEEAHAHVLDHPLMHPYEVDDQAFMQDVIGTYVLWT